jgi:YesN/AraC family two-component response regulator
MAFVLIIDDEPDFSEMLKLALVSGGHEVATARNGREGMEIVQSRHPALVITDILMPEFDGIEMIRALKKLSPSTRIVAVSGGDMRGPDYLGAAGEFGADIVLQKPLRPKEVVHTVAHLLEGRAR